MGGFAHLSFKWKLTLSLMVTSVIALLTACATFFFYDNYLFRDSMVKELQTTANVISAPSPQNAVTLPGRLQVNKTAVWLGQSLRVTISGVQPGFTSKIVLDWGQLA